MYKILVLGGRGMLGHMVAHVLSKQEKLVVKSTSSHKNSNYICFNIEKGIKSLKRILEKDGGFDYIINCTGLLIRNINVNDPNSIFRAVQILRIEKISLLLDIRLFILTFLIVYC